MHTLLWAISKSLFCEAKEIMLIINADIFKWRPSGYNFLVNIKYSEQVRWDFNIPCHDIYRFPFKGAANFIYHKINKANKQDVLLRLFLPQLQFMLDSQLSQWRRGLTWTVVYKEQKGIYRDICYVQTEEIWMYTVIFICERRKT